MSILESQSGTNYTHNFTVTEDIKDFDLLLFDTPYGVVRAHNIDDEFKCTQIVYFSSGTWYAIDTKFTNISSDGKSFTVNIAKWQNASTNEGVIINNVYGVNF